MTVPPRRTVLVTGASSGIGQSAAVQLARSGHRLLLTGRDEGRLAAVAARTGARQHPADLSRSEDLAALLAWIDAGDPPDAAVLNAGAGWAGPTAQMPDELAAQLVAVNLAAPVGLTRHLLPGMLRRGTGGLVLVSSIAGCLGVREEAVYSATKAAVRAFGDSLRWELAGSAVTVSVVLPGAVATPFFDRRGRAYDRSWPRPVPPERVAGVIVRVLDRPRPEVFVPGWLRLPARLNGGLPGLTAALARRLG